ncbi:MAG: hypothetical protein MJ149_01500 [Clostridia bacterium]|nr:hypothetical protein [Clostridia bacterium]
MSIKEESKAYLKLLEDTIADMEFVMEFVYENKQVYEEAFVTLPRELARDIADAKKSLKLLKIEVDAAEDVDLQGIKNIVYSYVDNFKNTKRQLKIMGLCPIKEEEKVEDMSIKEESKTYLKLLEDTIADMEFVYANKEIYEEAFVSLPRCLERDIASAKRSLVYIKDYVNKAGDIDLQEVKNRVYSYVDDFKNTKHQLEIMGLCPIKEEEKIEEGI